MKNYNYCQMRMILTLSVLISGLFLSCKNDSKKSDAENTQNDTTEVKEVDYKDAEIKEALYKGAFLKNEKGFDIAVMGNTIYLLKSNPSEEDKKNHFFLEITKKNISLPTKDLSPQDLFFSDSLSNNFSNILVYKYQIRDVEVPYNLLIGQFDNSQRTWHTFIHADQLTGNEVGYRNEYIENIKENSYLNEFESAFNEGYFMKSQDNFDLLLDDHTLYYIKPNGKDSDLQERFFLHVTYEDNERIVMAFAPKDFRIDNLLGNKYENFVILKKKIPTTKKIKEIGTGQFKNEVQFWSIVYQIDKLYNDMAFIYDDQYKEFISPKN